MAKTQLPPARQQGVQVDWSFRFLAVFLAFTPMLKKQRKGCVHFVQTLNWWCCSKYCQAVRKEVCSAAVFCPVKCSWDAPGTVPPLCLLMVGCSGDQEDLPQGNPNSGTFHCSLHCSSVHRPILSNTSNSGGPALAVRCLPAPELGALLPPAPGSPGSAAGQGWRHRDPASTRSCSCPSATMALCPAAPTAPVMLPSNGAHSLG